MSDRRHPEHTRSSQEWTDQTQRIRQPYPQYTDPAYSGQPYYPQPRYPGLSADPNGANPTDRLPQYWLQGQPPPDQPTEGPPPIGRRHRVGCGSSLLPPCCLSPRWSSPW